jgi:NTP pyrophosphatase (non-canonical NTP hydrolase)
VGSEQTLETMTPYLTEEAVESAEAIADGDPEKIAEELGDLVFLGIFCLELLSEKGRIGLADALERAAQKADPSPSPCLRHRAGR